MAGSRRTPTLVMVGLSSLSSSSHFAPNAQRCLGQLSNGRVEEEGDASGPGHQLAQQFQALCRQLADKKIDTRQIATRASQAADKPEPDRIIARAEDDGNRRGRGLSRQSGRGAERGDHGDPSANQFSRQRREPVGLIIRPAVFDRHVLTVDIAGVLEALAKCA